MTDFRFYLHKPPSTNSLYRNTEKGRRKTADYQTWINSAGWQLKEQRVKPVLGPVTIVIEYTPHDKRRRDISNLVKAVEDLLVYQGIIEADDMSIVRFAGSAVVPDVEKGSIRVRIRSCTENTQFILQHREAA